MRRRMMTMMMMVMMMMKMMMKMMMMGTWFRRKCSWQHLGDVVLALWYMMSETNTRSKTLHDPRQVKFAMESEGAAWYCWNAARVIQLMSQPLSERTICSNFSRRTDILGCSGKCSKVAQGEAVGKRDGPPLQKHQRRTAARDPKQLATQCDEGLPEHFRAAARC